MSDLPPPPGCHVELATRVLARFLHEELHRVGMRNAVLGVSGGVDSALVLELAARALGPEHVTALCMPYRHSDPRSLELARACATHAGTQLEVVELSDAADPLFRALHLDPDDDDPAARHRRGNVLARLRMATLYDWSARKEALVLGTSNKTELLLGYGTQHGDMASAINPIGDLYKSQVYALARHLDVPAGVLERAPSADLWEGQTDEDDLGFTYDAVDALLHHMVDRRRAPAALEAMGFGGDFVARVAERVRRNQFKRRPPLVAKLAHRTVNLDYRYARDWGTRA